MNLDKILLQHKGEPSASISLLALATCVLIIAIGLEMAGVIKTTSMSFEFFGSCAALYFGRRYTSPKGQVLDKE